MSDLSDLRVAYFTIATLHIVILLAGILDSSDFMCYTSSINN